MGTRGPGTGRKWILVAIAAAVIGSIGATVAAARVARSASDRERQQFETSSAEVASTLQLAIQHEEDLIVNARAFLADDRMTRTAELAGWIDRAHAVER